MPQPNNQPGIYLGPPDDPTRHLSTVEVIDELRKFMAQNDYSDTHMRSLALLQGESRYGNGPNAGPAHNYQSGYQTGRPLRHHQSSLERFAARHKKAIGIMAVALAGFLAAEYAITPVRTATKSGIGAIGRYASAGNMKSVYKANLPKPIPSNASFPTIENPNVSVSGIFTYTIDPHHIYQNAAAKTNTVGITLTATDNAQLFFGNTVEGKKRMQQVTAETYINGMRKAGTNTAVNKACEDLDQIVQQAIVYAPILMPAGSGMDNTKLRNSVSYYDVKPNTKLSPKAGQFTTRIAYMSTSGAETDQLLCGPLK